MLKIVKIFNLCFRPAFQVHANLFPREVSMIDSLKGYIFPSLFIQNCLIPRYVTLSLNELEFVYNKQGRELAASESGKEKITPEERPLGLVYVV